MRLLSSMAKLIYLYLLREVAPVIWRSGFVLVSRSLTIFLQASSFAVFMVYGAAPAAIGPSSAVSRPLVSPLGHADLLGRYVLHACTFRRITSLGPSSYSEETLRQQRSTTNPILGVPASFPAQVHITNPTAVPTRQH